VRVATPKAWLSDMAVESKMDLVHQMASAECSRESRARKGGPNRNKQHDECMGGKIKLILRG
jgi:hypothetical protein